MRPDKATLAGVAATLALYRAGRALEAIPVWRMIAAPTETLRDRAVALVSAARSTSVAVVALDSTVGGGSLPGETLPSFGVALSTRSATRTLAALRRGEPPVIGRIADGRVLLDLRTVAPADDERLASAIAAILEVPE